MAVDRLPTRDAIEQIRARVLDGYDHRPNALDAFYEAVGDLQFLLDLIGARGD